jgi:hypothetical protein
MYQPVSRHSVLDALNHLRNLYRNVRLPGGPVEEEAQAARETFIRRLIANIKHSGSQPTPRVLFDLTRHFQLTTDGAYRLFGYNLSRIQDYDFRLNGHRTHIIESYPFYRDLPVDLPFELADDEVFERSASVQELVREWQRGVPIGSIEGKMWQRPDMIYIHIGSDDSLTSHIPPGAIASVELIGHEERMHPDPDVTYLLLFGDGGRCSRCEVSEGRLFLRDHVGNRIGSYAFDYPRQVRILGRVRMFSLRLPSIAQPSASPISLDTHAPLLLPWRYPSIQDLFASKSLRFRRSEQNWSEVRETIESALHIRISSRTVRRYRQKTPLLPHTGTLIGLSLAYVTRYTDVLRVLRCFEPESNHYSLETLLNVERLSDLPAWPRAKTPTPIYRWTSLLKQWGEWPTLLSMTIPEPHRLGDRFLRIHQGKRFRGLDPLLPSGSTVLLKEAKQMPDTRMDRAQAEWMRPIYAIQYDDQTLCGYLENHGSRIKLVPHPRSPSESVVLARHRLRRLSNVIAAAVPV